MYLVMIGGSDAGISAALRAREVDPAADVTVVLEDAYPNFSICGIPYYLSGEVTSWRTLAHRTLADLEAAGMRLRLDTIARRIDVPGRKLLITSADGAEELLGYDKLIVGTGAVPVRPPIAGLAGPAALGPDDGVHVLHGDLDLSCTPPLGSPWEAVQMGTLRARPYSRRAVCSCLSLMQGQGLRSSRMVCAVCSGSRRPRAARRSWVTAMPARHACSNPAGRGPLA